MERHREGEWVTTQKEEILMVHALLLGRLGRVALEPTQDFKVTLGNTARPSQERMKFEFHLYVSAPINFTTCKLL